MARSRFRTTLILVLLTVVFVGAVPAAPAGPARAATNGTAFAEDNIGAPALVSFTAGIGRENQVVISGSGGVITIDDAFPITPGRNCEQAPGTSPGCGATCSI